MLAAMAMVPIVSADETQNLALQQDIRTIVRTPVRLADPAETIMASTQQSPQTYAMPENDKQEIFKAIDKSILSKKEKTELKKKLGEIWSGTPKLSDDEKKAVFSTVYSIVMKPDVIKPTWSGYPVDPYYMDVHNDMAWIAGYSMGLGQNSADTLKSMAGQPDVPPPSASWNHYYSSGAADQAAWYAYLSSNEWISDHSQALQYLAYSMHYIADMSQPFHYWFAQSLPQHAEYENFVGQNWHSSDLNFYNSAANDGYYYYITNVRDSASYLAWRTHYSQNQYDYINDKILNDPNWRTDQTLIRYTRECLVDGERYQMGLVDWVQRNVNAA
ncbi:MAG: hypothetical protein WC586_06675 [Methanoregula sp.]